MYFLFVINIIPRTKEKYRKGRRLKFCRTVHCAFIGYNVSMWTCIVIYTHRVIFHDISGHCSVPQFSTRRMVIACACVYLEQFYNCIQLFLSDMSCKKALQTCNESMPSLPPGKLFRICKKAGKEHFHFKIITPCIISNYHVNA